MVSIRGPRSALTDFIEEHGIKIRKSPVKFKLATAPSKNKKTSHKTVKNEKPLELGNLDSELSLEDVLLTKISLEIDKYNLNDKHLELLSAYLSRTRKMSAPYFKYIVSRCTDEVVIYDCSMITDDLFVIEKNLKRLELHYAGQLTSQRINRILRGMPSLEYLKITGAYLLDDIELPKKLKVLDVSYCSRLTNKFIDRINLTYKHLEELRLSYCYSLNEDCYLQISVSKLYVCETKVTKEFLMSTKNLSQIKELSLKRCVNISDLSDFDFKRIEYLDVEGITTITELRLPNTVKNLNVAFCYNLRNFNFPNLEQLNLSHISLQKAELQALTKLRKLKVLNVSWNENVNDEIVDMLLNSTTVSTLFVFGCFELTTVTAKRAWEIRNKTKIVGNPAETHYLLCK